MRKFYRNIVVLLAITALFLTGCGSPPQTETMPEQTEIPALQTEIPTIQTEAPTEAREEERTVFQNRPVTVGEFAGSSYLNHYMGIGYDIDQDWTILTADMLQELPENLEEVLQSTDVSDGICNNYLDFTAVSADRSINISVEYNRMSEGEMAFLASISEQAMNEIYAETLRQLVPEQAPNADKVEIRILDDVEYLGQLHLGILTEVQTGQKHLFVLQVHNKYLGNCGTVVTVGAPSEETAREIIRNIYALD